MSARQYLNGWKSQVKIPSTAVAPQLACHGTRDCNPIVSGTIWGLLLLGISRGLKFGTTPLLGGF